MFAETEFTATSAEIRIQEKLAVFLALIAGYLDAVGIVKWKMYVSFMSGNTTQLGISLSTANSAVIITTFTVIAFFILGIYYGVPVCHFGKDLTLKNCPFIWFQEY